MSTTPSRYLKDLEKRRSKIIHIYRNGDPYSRATFIILRLFEQLEMERIIRAIEEKVRLTRNRPIKRLYDMEGKSIIVTDQVEDGKYYVAASAEPFQSVDYGHPLNWVRVGPVRTEKYANYHYLSRREEANSMLTRLTTSNSALATTTSNNNNQNKPKPRKSNAKGSKNVKSLKRKDKDAAEINMTKMSASEHFGEVSAGNQLPEMQQQIHTETDHTTDQNTQEGLGENVVNNQPEAITQNEDNDTNTDINNTSSNNDAMKEEMQENVVEDGETNIVENNEPQTLINHKSDNNIEEDDANEEQKRNEAAVKIQANYRGFHVRHSLENKQNSEAPMDSLDDTTEPLDENSQF